MPIHGYPGGVITANPVAPTASVATGVWTTEQQLQAVSQGNWPGYEYPIANSLRFNSADSAYLSRTFGTPTNATTWTLSCWIKRSKFGTARIIMQAGATNTNNGLWSTWNSTDIVGISNSAGSALCTSTAVKRDPSAWSHLVVTNNAGTFTWYENNQNIASGSGTCNINQSGTTHYIGSGSGTNYFFDGYMTEINFVDGQALTPSSFGLNDPETGVWSPKRYTGTYGTNGFYLNFSDNSGTTSTTLGKDSSGNGNNWTPNNFSVTAGAGNDSLVDTPTSYGTDTGAGGEVRGNYCTLNPLSTTAGTYTQGNLRYVGASAWRRSNSTISMSTGKWYWEVTLGNAPYTPRASNSGYNAFGFGLSTVFNSTTASASVTDAVILSDSGYYKNFSGSNTDGGTAFSNGDTLAIAVDLDANTFTFYRNNTQITTGTIGGTAGRELVPIILSYDGSYGVMDCNFGQRPFAYTAPSGFKALCTQNLPTPTIGATSTTQANDYFNAVLYTGNSSGASVTGVGFAPDFIWTKSRSNVTNHELIDIVRGGSSTLFSNLTNAEATQQRISAFGSDGWTYTTNSNSANTGYTFVGWNWKANGAGSSNTAGTITSTVSANTTSGFSIVTYTGTGANATVGHGLGVAPSMIICKSRSNTYNWVVYHTSIGNTQNLKLNLTDAATVASTSWNNTSPTSSVFSLGSSLLGNDTGNMVAYCFAPVAGYSAFGSYTGNGSADGPFVYTGFRPRYVLIKDATNSATEWGIEDTVRDTDNPINLILQAESSAAEATATNRLDILSNGFKIRSTGFMNTNNATIIYAAFAESPFKYSLAR